MEIKWDHKLHIQDLKETKIQISIEENMQQMKYYTYIIYEKGRKLTEASTNIVKKLRYWEWVRSQHLIWFT